MVHAHPDDESLATGGTLAHYAACGRPLLLETHRSNFTTLNPGAKTTKKGSIAKAKSKDVSRQSSKKKDRDRGDSQSSSSQRSHSKSKSKK